MSFSPLPRLGPDPAAIISQLLVYPGVQVRYSADVDTFGEAAYPLLIWRCFGGVPVRNGLAGAGQVWNLAISAFNTSEETTFDLANTVYQVVHGFPDQSPSAFGWVSSVDDAELFDRVTSVGFPDKTVVQYTGVFTIRVRS